VICRGEHVVDRYASPPVRARAARNTHSANLAFPSPSLDLAAVSKRTILVSMLCLTIVIAMLPGRAQIPPLVESDYAYTFISVDRAMQGHGFTAPPPVAPLVPYEWHGDWGFLTHWPVGYPAILFALRWLTGWTTIVAARWVGVVATAVALVGWFAWLRTNLPRSVAGFFVSCVGAASSVSIGTLVNPSTDLIVTAAIPYLLIAIRRVTPPLVGGDVNVPAPPTRGGTTFLIGLLSGALFWIRYASIFAPAAIAIYVLLRKCASNRRRISEFGRFAIGAALPIAALIALNAWKAYSTSLQGQLNLGSRASFDFSMSLLVKAWREFTNLGFYNYHSWMHDLISLWPIVLVIAALLFPSARAQMRKFSTRDGVGISVVMTAMLLAMLIVATACFGAKFNYIELDRYYVPIRPLYFLLFIGPLLYIPRRFVRAAVTVILLVAMNWTIRYEWMHDYSKARSKDRIATPYGEWSRCFGPDAAKLFASLEKFRSEDYFLVSNFPEYVTLETGIACAGLPSNSDALVEWLHRFALTGKPRSALFVLDSSPRWRAHWLPKTEDIVSGFGLITSRDDRRFGNELDSETAGRLFGFPCSVYAVWKYGTRWD